MLIVGARLGTTRCNDRKEHGGMFFVSRDFGFFCDSYCQNRLSCEFLSDMKIPRKNFSHEPCK